MKNQDTLPLMEALRYVAGRKCINCSPTVAAGQPAPELCSHDMARKTLAEHEGPEQSRLIPGWRSHQRR